MNLINRYIKEDFKEIFFLGGAVVSSLVILFKVLLIFINDFPDNARFFGYAFLCFIVLLYFFAVVLYFPIKFLLKLKLLKESILNNSLQQYRFKTE